MGESLLGREFVVDLLVLGEVLPPEGPNEILPRLLGGILQSPLVVQHVSLPSINLLLLCSAGVDNMPREKHRPGWPVSDHEEEWTICVE